MGQLIPTRHLTSGTPWQQAHVNSNVHAFADDVVEILPGADVLAATRVRRFGKARTFHECSCAFGAAIGFTWARHGTLFVLHHRRPVGTDYNLYHLGKVLAEHLRRCQYLDTRALLPI